MEYVKPDWTIGRIIAEYPETRAIFISNGFPVLADDDVLNELGPVLKLKTALLSKHLNIEAFIRLLEEKIDEGRRLRDLGGTIPGAASQLNMLTFVPCPLKVPLQGEIRHLLNRLRQETGLELDYSIDISANKQANYEEYSKYFENPEELPDIILTTGYDFFHKQFVDRFVKTGVFARLSRPAVNPRLAEAGIADPGGCFNVIAVNILVMVVDMKRLGKLPVPKTWNDLLDPIYEKQVVIRGHGDVFCDVVQLNYYKDAGDAGINGLARAVRYGLHPAQMVKELGSGRADVPPIHVMPRFFAETISNRRNIAVIWPEDGALAYPISLLVKAAKLDELKAVVDYLTGPEVARICDDAHFPALHPQGGRNLPAGAGFKWPGWDYIRNSDMEVLQEELNRKFLQALGRGGVPCS